MGDSEKTAEPEEPGPEPAEGETEPSEPSEK